VILVGHSFGGPPITGSRRPLPERIKQLVYLMRHAAERAERVQPAAARSCRGTPQGCRRHKWRLEHSATAGSVVRAKRPVQQAWLAAKLTPHPLGTYESPLNLKEQIANGLPATYISCTDPAYAPLNAARNG